MGFEARIGLSQRALPPQRLVRMLRPPGPLTVLGAPDGFGKTTLLRWWASHWPTPVLWASGPADEEAGIGEIATALRASLGRGAGLAALLGAPAGDNAPGLARALCRAIPIGRQVSIVIDDATPALLELAIDLSASLVALRRRDLALIVAGRVSSAPLEISRAPRQPLWLGPEALRLRPAELRRALARLLDRAPSAAEVEEVAAITDGWPAGLQMAAAILRAGRGDLLRSVARSELVLGLATEMALTREQPAA